MKANGKPTPRRPIEREYLATLNAAVPLDTWQAICKRAADDALAGDAWSFAPRTWWCSSMSRASQFSR